MKLIFYGRQAVPAAPLGAALLTIEQKGVFSLNTAAVADLGLAPSSPLVLASDAETNAWYLLLSVPAGEQSFVLKPRDSKSSKALVFHSQPQARAYWQAHGLNGQKSVRALVSATPLEHEGLKLYPLSPQHPTTPAPAAEAAPAVPAEVASQPDVAPLPSDLPFLQAEPARAESAATAEPVVDETLEARMERLTDHWYERDIKQCPDAELAELQSLLADKPKKERDIVENTVLNACKTEVARRKRKGGDRG